MILINHIVRHSLPLGLLCLGLTALLAPMRILAAEPIESTILSEGEEQPLELYVISWPDIEPMTAENPPVRLLIIEEPQALDPRVFKREIEYYNALQTQP